MIITFFSNPFFNIVGGIFTIISVCSLLYTIYLMIIGVVPVWIRLGLAISKRRIAIFAKPEKFPSLKSMLVDSKIFKEKNIVQINPDDLRKAEKESLFLVHWKSFEDNIDEVLSIKKDTTTLIVYAPRDEGDISPELFKKISNQRNTIIVNLRGRLLNDVFVSLMTTY